MHEKACLRALVRQGLWEYMCEDRGFHAQASSALSARLRCGVSNIGHFHSSWAQRFAVFTWVLGLRSLH